jgi:predicted RNA polymerase sigma factor
VRAELLVRAGRTVEAMAELDVAVSACRNEVERAHLERRRSAIG